MFLARRSPFAISRRTNSMHARAAGERLRSPRQTSATGSRWGATGGEGGDHFLVGQSLDAESLADLAGQQAEGGVELVGGEKAQHVGGNALAETDFDYCFAHFQRSPSRHEHE